MNDLVQLRKIVMHFEEIYHEGGPPPGKPLVRAAILAVAKNPYAGEYVEDVLPYMEALGPLGTDLTRRLLDALGGAAQAIEGFGKGAIVGTAGELEHGALWHAPGGQAMRRALGAKAIVPSTKKIGVAGARLDVPITHINASYVRSHFDAMEVTVADAPRPNEIVLILAMTTGARIHARSAGLKASEIKGEDGLRGDARARGLRLHWPRAAKELCLAGQAMGGAAMAHMIAEVYHAFRAANVPEEEAQAAATAVAERDQDIADLRHDVVELRHEMNGRFAKIEGELWSYRWLFGIIITMQLAILLLLLRPALAP